MKKFKIILLILLLVLVVSCNKEKETKPIVVGQTWVLASVEPKKGGTPWSLTSHGISESVYALNSKGELKSRFVKDLKNIDKFSWQITLNEGIKFSDGSLLNAKSFSEALNTVMKENPLSNATVGKIEFKEKSEYKVIAKTEKPTKVLDSVLAEWTNIIFKKEGDKYIFTGPFVIDKLESGVKVKLKPNPNYPDSAKRKNVIIKAFKDVTSMKLAVESGEIDMAFTVSPEVSKMLKGKNVVVKTIDAGYQYFAPINLKGVLKDKDVRKAIDLALNREDFIKGLNGGNIPTGLFANYNSFKGDIKLRRDVEKAKELLKGKDITIEIVTYPTRPDLTTIMQLMATQLKEVGIKVNTKIVENIDEYLKEKKFDIALYTQHTSPTSNPAFFLNQFFRTNGSKNHMSYSSEKLDKILDKMNGVARGEKMDKLSKEAQAQIYKDLPVLLLVDPKWHIALSEKLKDYKPYSGDYYIINDKLFEK